MSSTPEADDNQITDRTPTAPRTGRHDDHRNDGNGRRRADDQRPQAAVVGSARERDEDEAEPDARGDGERDGRCGSMLVSRADGTADEGDRETGDDDADDGRTARTLAQREADDDGEHGTDDRCDRCDHGHRATRQRAVERDQREDRRRHHQPRPTAGREPRRSACRSRSRRYDQSQAGGLADQGDDGAGNRARRAPTAVVGEAVGHRAQRRQQDRHSSLLAEHVIRSASFVWSCTCNTFASAAPASRCRGCASAR